MVVIYIGYSLSLAGSLAPFEVDLKLWPKEQCFEAAVSIVTRSTWFGIPTMPVIEGVVCITLSVCAN